jgi:hypothetical protein
MRAPIRQGGRRRPLATSALVASFGLLAASVGVAEQDHLKGYTIKDLNQVAPPANPYTITNQFGSETCDLKKAQFLLVQSEKNNGDDARGGPAGNFVCYKAKCSKSLPPVTDENSQFGTHTLEIKKAKMVCLPVIPPPVACPGQLVGGSCWLLGALGESCDTACGGVGMTCDPVTETYAGSGGTDADCLAVLTALGVTDTYSGGQFCLFSNPVGCVDEPQSTSAYRCNSPVTTCAGSGPSLQRACACQ